ncbi:MAG: hypothetical protein K2M30_00260 [Desulfovibrionaceae bacterium]|nr:hypothetical protein [Desulfovibrionaceae bacterium]
MNGINNNVSINTALLQGIGEQISETSKSDKKDSIQEVTTAKPNLESLGQNQVSTQDIAGVKTQVSINDLASGVPTLTEPNKEASQDVMQGKSGNLFGEVSGASMILTLMLESLNSANETRQLQREVSTTQQNIAIQEGMQQVDKMMQSADKTRMGAITQGVVGALGTGVSLGGLAGMNSSLRSSMSDKLGISSAKEKSLQNKLHNNTHKQLKLVNKEFTASRTGGKLSNADKTQLRQLRAKAEQLQTKLNAIKDPTSASAKALQQAKSDNIKAAMELFSGNVTTVNNITRTSLESDAATLNAKGQLDNVRAETAKTERTKSEANYDNTKATITSMMRVLSDILQALNNASSSAARA